MIAAAPYGGNAGIVASFEDDSGGADQYDHGQFALSGAGGFFGVAYYTVNGEGGPTFIYTTNPVADMNSDGTRAIEDQLPLQISLSNAQATPGENTTLTWSANNAFSDNMKVCFASGAWSGVKSYTGSLSFSAPPTPGTYRYALTCGGIETSAVLLYDAVPQVSLTITPNELAVGESATVSVQVNGNNGTAQGSVALMDGAATLLTLPLNSSGAASTTVSTAHDAPGKYSLTAVYGGSASYATAQSAAATVILLAAKYPCSRLSLTVSPATVSGGQTVTLTASASASYWPVTSGAMTFNIGSLVLGTAAIQSSNDEAVLQLVAPNGPAGSYPVTATYNGNSYTGTCTSSPVTVTLTGPPASVLTLTASPSTVTPPATVTLNATQSTASGKPAPTGTVQFYNGATYLGASSLNGSGMATFALSTSGYSAGTATITANYLGDANYTKDSAMAQITVN